MKWLDKLLGDSGPSHYRYEQGDEYPRHDTIPRQSSGGWHGPNIFDDGRRNGEGNSYAHDRHGYDRPQQYDSRPMYTGRPPYGRDTLSSEADDRAIALALEEEERHRRHGHHVNNVDEDEQLAKAMQESLNFQYSDPRRTSDYNPSYPPPSRSNGVGNCAGCNESLGYGRFLSCLGKNWHPNCFVCKLCTKPIADREFSVQGSEAYHRECYKELFHPKCEVCMSFIPTNAAGLIEYRSHPFWNQKYCPRHERDGTPRCCSCDRIEVMQEEETTKDPNSVTRSEHSENYKQKGLGTKRKKSITSLCSQNLMNGKQCGSGTRKRNLTTSSCSKDLDNESNKKPSIKLEELVSRVPLVLTGGRGTYEKLDDGRQVCLECLDSIVVDTKNCQPLYREILEFYKGIGMPIEQIIPMLLVERSALNAARDNEKDGHSHTAETRGLCLSEEQTITTVFEGKQSRNPMRHMRLENQKLTRHCEVTAILVLFGLPRLLTGSILAHELMHAWLRLQGTYPSMRPEVEEGICQVMSHIWLTNELKKLNGNKSSSSSSSSSRTNSTQAALQIRLAEFYLHQISTDSSPIYGDGYRHGFAAVQEFGLSRVLEHLRLTANFP